MSDATNMAHTKLHSQPVGSDYWDYYVPHSDLQESTNSLTDYGQHTSGVSHSESLSHSGLDPEWLQYFDGEGSQSNQNPSIFLSDPAQAYTAPPSDVSGKAKLPSKGRLGWAKWRKETSDLALEQVFKSVSSLWPQEMPPNARKRCETALYNILRKNKSVRTLLLKFDAATIEHVAYQTSPDQLRNRARRKEKNHDIISPEDDAMQKVPWLAMKMTKADIDCIVHQLSLHWNITPEETSKALSKYASRTGPITSPEVLFDADQKSFELAADIITVNNEGRKSMTVMPIRCNDILHRENSKYSHIDDKRESEYTVILVRTTQANARRLRSQEWHSKYSPQAIKVIQAKIADQWVDGMSRSVLDRRIESANKYLQDHQSLIDLIASGDDDAAFEVAEASIKDSVWLKREYRKLHLGV